MRWEDEGLLLSVRKYGETSALIELLTHTHGKRAGLLRGAFSKNIRPIIQPGNQLQTTWSSRLEHNLGEFKVELVRSRFHLISRNKEKIDLLNLVCTFCSAYLPERDSMNNFYQKTINLLDSEKELLLNLLGYIKWEMTLLKDLGFGLDLRKCVVTGSSDCLPFVSPKSGCAVSQQAAKGWEDKLLILPDFLRNKDEEENVSKKEIEDGLLLTGYFLKKWLSPVKNYNSELLFHTRDRLLDYLRSNL